jgi:hypothetical protein
MRAKSLCWLMVALVVVGLSCAPGSDQGARTTSKEGEPIRPPVLPPRSLKDRVEAALLHVKQRDLLTTHAFWTIFHGILGTGPETTLLDMNSGKRVNALEYVCNGGPVRGMEFIETPDGLDVQTAQTPELLFVGQGHQDQFIAEMAQWGMPLNKRFVVRGKDYTFEDFVRHCKARARVSANQELSWAIVVIGQYYGTDASWTNSFGEKLHFEDLVRYELKQPVETAACGGTHRLFGLTWVYHLHLAKGGQKTGVWKDLEERTQHYQNMARKYQNGDGSFSTQYLAGPGKDRDKDRRINTTGHVLEWLALSLPQRELTAPWMQEAVSALSLMILEAQDAHIDGGSLYHAAHGLHIYQARVFGRTSAPAGLLIPLPPGEQLTAKGK